MSVTGNRTQSCPSRRRLHGGDASVIVFLAAAGAAAASLGGIAIRLLIVIEKVKDIGFRWHILLRHFRGRLVRGC